MSKFEVALLKSSQGVFFYSIIMDNNIKTRTLSYKGVDYKNDPSLQDLVDFLAEMPYVVDNIDNVDHYTVSYTIEKILYCFDTNDSIDAICKIKESCIEEFL